MSVINGYLGVDILGAKMVNQNTSHHWNTMQIVSTNIIDVPTPKIIDPYIEANTQYFTRSCASCGVSSHTECVPVPTDQYYPSPNTFSRQIIYICNSCAKEFLINDIQ